MLPFELLPNFHTRGPAFFLLALGPINFGASGDGGKIKLSCVSLAELTFFTPPTHTHGLRRARVTQGPQSPGGTIGSWRPAWPGNPLGYNCSQGLLAWLVNSHSLTAVLPPQLLLPSYVAQVRNHSWAPAKGV